MYTYYIMFQLTSAGILSLISHYGYLIVFPIAILEGPIISILAGFLVSLGQLNYIIVFLIIMAGDVIGDTMYYALGRWGEKFVRKHGIRVGLTETRIEQTKKYFHENHKKAVVISKVAHGIGMVGLIVAGILKVPYNRYIKTCLIITSIQAFILLTLGVLFGHAYVKIEKYLNLYVAIASVIVLITATLYALYKIKNSDKFLK